MIRTISQMLKYAPLTALLLAGQAKAAGFALAEQGAAASGNASAHTASKDSPDLAYFNPALLALSPGFRAQLGASFLFSSLEHDGEALTKTESPPGTPPTLKLSYIHDFEAFRAGMSIYAGVPFGSGVTWPNTWPGRFEITSIQLRVWELNLNPVVHTRVAEVELSLGGGPRLLASTVGLTRKIDAVENEGEVELAGEASGVAWQANGAVTWKGVTLGAHYRSPKDLSFEGSADFRDVPPELSGRAQDQNVSTMLGLPSRLAIGVSWRHQNHEFMLDVERFGWSSFETFGINFENPDTPDVLEPRLWQDTWSFRGGYHLRLLEERLSTRAGFAWDPSPAPAATLSPTLPDADRVSGTLGAGWKFGSGVSTDIAFGATLLLEREPTNPNAIPGKIRGSIPFVAVGVSYEL